ncbi:MAG TPA: AglZ/HisF2 family acetamidino modification protein [Chitinophagaceae bacterium]|nr:AglZ/HisF2 family acetamidino modification protein [Chitinophagaceae bacterium]
MFRPRVIPVLLLKNKGLVKSRKFKTHHYIGDPINAVRIFNDLKADELIFLDIMATRENRLISLNFIRDTGHETCMPFAAGGGIRTLDDIRAIIQTGAEKVVIGTKAAEDPDFIHQAAETFGSSTIVVCMDCKRNWLGKLQVMTRNGCHATAIPPVDFAFEMERQGAGEIIVQSMEKDGMMTGYDISLTRSIVEAVNIPVIALGGAGDLSHLKQLYQKAAPNGLAAGSMFVYKGIHKGVLINYPEKKNCVFDTPD